MELVQICRTTFACKDCNRQVRLNWLFFAWGRILASSDPDSSSFAPSIKFKPIDKNATGFCIIQGPEIVEDFANMKLQEI
uniref:Uncharacterized protein n=1 Tax=Cannabis sativa TaxID=3483 RepID=A0A803QY04_CANSA